MNHDPAWQLQTMNISK